MAKEISIIEFIKTQEVKINEYLMEQISEYSILEEGKRAIFTVDVSLEIVDIEKEVTTNVSFVQKNQKRRVTGYQKRSLRHEEMEKLKNLVSELRSETDEQKLFEYFLKKNEAIGAEELKKLFDIKWLYGPLNKVNAMLRKNNMDFRLASLDWGKDITQQEYRIYVTIK